MSIHQLLEDSGQPSGVARIRINGQVKCLLYYGQAIMHWSRLIEWSHQAIVLYDPETHGVKFYQARTDDGPLEAFRALERDLKGELLTEFIVPRDHLNFLVEQELTGSLSAG